MVEVGAIVSEFLKRDGCYDEVVIISIDHIRRPCSVLSTSLTNLNPVSLPEP